MARPGFILLLLFVGCFSLATYLQPLQAAREKSEGQSGDFLVLLLGDGRKMFANEFFAKADAYFHRGNYPSIFDQNAGSEENHMTAEAVQGNHTDEDHSEHKTEAVPGDWIERFGRHFYPTEHVHLANGEEREMLPWLRISAELDPHRVETYTVTAYWLRDRLGKVDEAEQFLRDGLRANPNNPELLYELGRLCFENRKDFTRARNLWVAALRRWREVEAAKDKPNEFLLEEILGSLARLEAQQGRIPQAIDYLQQLKDASPNPGAIQKQIDELIRRATEPPPNSHK